MKISYQWLKDFIDLPYSPDEVAHMLTLAGLEVESIHRVETVKGGLAGVVIGQVLTCQKHPNADKLSLTTVDIGGSVVPIVCGAPNVAAGQKVLVATVGTTLYPTSGEPLTIKKAKIRGQVSEGMICAEDELGLGPSHEGIMVLETDLPPGTPAAEFFQLQTDFVFEIGLTPNHADAASHYGIARELHALTGLPICFPDLLELSPKEAPTLIQVIVEDPQGCPRYSGVVIRGVEVKESPLWLQQRLKSVGLNPINNVVDVTNYVLHELGQPLHAFDLDKIADSTVRVKTLPEGTPFRTLDGVERTLAAQDLVICDGNSTPLCIAGVFGGKESGITSSTKAIFLESAYFNPAYVRATSLRHGLKTDAAYRFERGTDPNMTIKALQRAAALILQTAGGEIASHVIDIYPQPIPHRQFSISYKNIDRLIGKKLDRSLIRQILQRLEINILQATDEAMVVSVPPYRVDIYRDADIVEEILRIYGYDKIELQPCLKADYLAEHSFPDKFRFRMELTKMLAGSGFQEIVCNSLTKPTYAQAMGVPPEENVLILNPLGVELSALRRTLLFSGLEVIAYNIHRRQKDLKLFEFGKIYYRHPSGEQTAGYVEQELLSLFATGNQRTESWLYPDQKADFFYLKGALQKILQKFGAADRVAVKEIDEDPLLAYGLAVLLQGREIARLGAVKWQHLKLVDLKQAVFYGQVDWTYLVEKYQPVVYKEIPKFPEVRRDLSLVLDCSVTFDQIRDLVQQTEHRLIKSINVFDVFVSESLGSNKKAYAISFILQDSEQTLTDQVIDKTMDKLMEAFQRELGAVIRK
ncbi:MAG: phenylalanine--tRNA ligase subunit beta [Cytophagales bacterium]|nr:phenylalanine--tRNA ligase subunit beta [Bernardetiaceae bacterium]MDW8211220.1 phenylalanine--tRNA ligase subunit beta [Cytophagales bacterium]